MNRRAGYRAELAGLAEDDVPAYLTERSGLPGPRANLELVGAFADVAPPALIDRLAGDPDEYLRCCGVAGLGRLLVDAPDGPDRADLAARLTGHARDASWRVREAVATAAQRLGDAAPERLRELVARWVADPDPLVVRAGIAAVCEPRLLADPGTAAAALAACAAATAALTAARDRRDPHVRVLRQALGYCWSVAVAGDPEQGLPRFAVLRSDPDPDVAWVVRENLRKHRLRVLLGDAGATAAT